MLGLPTNNMVLGCRLPLKLNFPLHSHSPSKLSSLSGRRREASFNLTRFSFLSVLYADGNILSRDTLKLYSFATETIQNESASVGVKIDLASRCESSFRNKIDYRALIEANTSSKCRGSSQFRLLMDNLDVLEKSFADSEVLKLERDILIQLGRLGALELFYDCLSKTAKPSNIFGLFDVPTVDIGESKTNRASNNDLVKTVVSTGKKNERRSRRERASSKSSSKAIPTSQTSKTTEFAAPKPLLTSSRKASKRRRLMIGKNEAEMSKGVKMVANLERIKTMLEKQTGQMVSLNCWAEAAGLDKMLLLQSLRFGWYCKDELIRSTRSLVLFLARNYRGFGVPMEDLLQAGNMGVLQGAERFDHTRGYRFSTYVQYWIRKSMSKAMALQSRAIHIPCKLSQNMNKIQKARKAFNHSHGNYPDDEEIAKITGLSLAKIESASKCQRVVGSIDQKVGGSMNAKYLEFIRDESMKCPEEAILRQHMKNEIHQLLGGLNSREKQVFIMRFGLKDHQAKTLEEIGRQFNVSKEWVRRIQNKVIKRLREEETIRNLSHYANL